MHSSLKTPPGLRKSEMQNLSLMYSTFFSSFYSLYSTGIFTNTSARTPRLAFPLNTCHHRGMQCNHWDRGECHSCTWLPIPYDEQIAQREAQAREALAHVSGYDALTWLSPCPSPTEGFRNKAKLAVGGTVTRPTLGVTGPRPDYRVIDLPHCTVTSPRITAILPALKALIRTLRLEPYSVAQRRGELKYILVTEGSDGALMLRFVLRSTRHLAHLRRALPQMQTLIPHLSVVTANIHPAHAALVEGDEEIVLTRTPTLPMRVGDVELHLGPRSFSQTNTQVAGELYRQVASWASRPLSHMTTEGAAPTATEPLSSEAPPLGETFPPDSTAPHTLWDLYCGVGGFALHAATHGIPHVTGVEISASAIESATRASGELGLLEHTSFIADDATAWARRQEAASAPDVIIVNPPRRGIGADLAAWLNDCPTPRVIYSSCNPTSLGRDVEAMPALRPLEARLFDMFPHTSHSEVAVLLERRGA